MLDIAVVKTGGEMLQCLALRHRVFVETYKYFRNKTPLIYDEFDTIPNNFTVIATKDKQMSGSLRITHGGKDNPTPADKYFDFRAVIGNHDYLSGSMLCCTPGSQAAYWLILYGFLYANACKINHMIACVNPKIESLLNKMTFKRVGDVFQQENFPQPILPMHTTTQCANKILGDLLNLTDTQLYEKHMLIYQSDEWRARHVAQDRALQNYVQVNLQKEFQDKRGKLVFPYHGPERRTKMLYRPGDRITEQYYASLSH